MERFLAALTGGDLQGLMDVLAPDVVVVADGGGLAPASLGPVSGRWRVANALSRFAQLAPRVEITTPMVNGTVGARIDPGGEFDTRITFVVEEGRISRMYAMRNPHKLGRLDEVAELRRRLRRPPVDPRPGGQAEKTRFPGIRTLPWPCHPSSELHGSSVADVLEVVLDKGIVLDAYARVSLIGIELLTVDARVVIASVDTYLRFADAVNRLDLQPRGQKTAPGLMLEATETAAKAVTKHKLKQPAERVQGFIESITGRSPETEGQ